MTIDDKGLVERQVAQIFDDLPAEDGVVPWAAIANARDEVLRLVARPSPALPADDAGLAADPETMWHFPVPTDASEAREYSETAKRAAEALSRREWQPIETAPKEPLNSLGEGPTILLYGGFSNGGARTGHWKGVKTNAWCDTAIGRLPRDPTHWMPLPPPPAASQPAGGGDD